MASDLDFLDYSTGTITLTSGSVNFTTQGAALNAVGIRPGDDLRVKGWIVTIATITGANSGTLRLAWPQATQTAQPYQIRGTPDSIRLMERARALMERLNSGNIDALAGLSLTANNLLYADAPGSLALAPMSAYMRGLLNSTNASAFQTSAGLSAPTFTGKVTFSAGWAASRDAKLVAASGDFNDLITSGQWSISGTWLNAPPNSASASITGTAEVHERYWAAGCRFTQIVNVSGSSVQRYIRVGTGVDGSIIWSAWERYAFQGAVDAAMAKRVRVDAAQSLTTTEQARARTNIGAPSSSDVDTALAKRVRVDAAQALTTTEQAQGRANIAAQANLGFSPVNKAGDSMSGAFYVENVARAIEVINAGFVSMVWHVPQKVRKFITLSEYGAFIFADQGGYVMAVLDSAGNLAVTGSISKASGTFLIDHPLDPYNKDLAHGFVEAPRYDLIYRGVARLVAGRALINIDADSNMSDGTFAALTTNAVVSSLQNQDGFARVRPGPIDGGMFEIICEDETCNDAVAWVVIAERNDPFIRSGLEPNTDENGRFVPEREKPE